MPYKYTDEKVVNCLPSGKYRSAPMLAPGINSSPTDVLFLSAGVTTVVESEATETTWLLIKNIEKKLTKPKNTFMLHFPCRCLCNDRV